MVTHRIDVYPVVDGKAVVKKPPLVEIELPGETSATEIQVARQVAGEAVSQMLGRLGVDNGTCTLYALEQSAEESAAEIARNEVRRAT